MSLIGLLTANGKTGSPGETPHETHPVASKTTLESSRIPGKGDSCSKVPSPTPSMVDQVDKCLDRTTFTSVESCRSNLYRRLKRRLGCSLRRLHSKRHLVSYLTDGRFPPGLPRCSVSVNLIWDEKDAMTARPSGE